MSTDNTTSNSNTKLKLEQPFALWCRISDELISQQPKQYLNTDEYETQMKKIVEFDTIESFWETFQHIYKPDECKVGVEFQLFKAHIKPMWEDNYNKQGGKISIKLRKQFTTIIWEEMILALLSGKLPVKDEINGIVISCKKDCNVLQIWFRSYAYNIVNDIKQCIRDVLQIPDEIELETRQFFRQK